eukprot:4677640-Pleurochrysis_carterae.AAC.1
MGSKMHPRMGQSLTSTAASLPPPQVLGQLALHHTFGSSVDTSTTRADLLTFGLHLSLSRSSSVSMQLTTA